MEQGRHRVISLVVEKAEIGKNAKPAKRLWDQLLFMSFS